jgi:DNA-directed RNA polymerase subunit N (RpoN/RPB10)
MICIPASFLLYFGVGIFAFIVGVVAGASWVSIGDAFEPIESDNSAIDEIGINNFEPTHRCCICKKPISHHDSQFCDNINCGGRRERIT